MCKWICELLLRRPLIICYFVLPLWCVCVCVCVCVCMSVWLRHSSSRNSRRCDLRDTGFCSFWGLRGAEVSEFQFPPKSHSQLHIRTYTRTHTHARAHTDTHTHTHCLYYLWKLFLFPSAINTLHFIHRRRNLASHLWALQPPHPLI